MVSLRMDRRLQGRIDPSDVIQETYVEASARLAEYLNNPSMPFFLWLRFLTGQKLLTLHRHHLGVRCATPTSRSRLIRPLLEASSAALAAHSWTMSPSQRGSDPCGGEDSVQEALERMNPLDREVLALTALRAS